MNEQIIGKLVIVIGKLAIVIGIKAITVFMNKTAFVHSKNTEARKNVKLCQFYLPNVMYLSLLPHTFNMHKEGCIIHKTYARFSDFLTSYVIFVIFKIFL